jgi:hypothetical protein
MDSTFSQTQPNPHRDDEVVPLVPEDSWIGVEEALAKLAHHAGRGASDGLGTRGFNFSADVRVTKPLVEETTLGPTDLNNDSFPSFRRRSTYVLFPLIFTACIGAATTLAYRVYGDAAQQRIASWTAQRGNSSSLAPM